MSPILYGVANVPDLPRYHISDLYVAVGCHEALVLARLPSAEVTCKHTNLSSASQVCKLRGVKRIANVSPVILGRSLFLKCPTRCEAYDVICLSLFVNLPSPAPKFPLICRMEASEHRGSTPPQR
jgi:hypothetical protein